MLAIVYVLRSGEVTFITTPYRRRVVWVSLREGRRLRLALSRADAPPVGSWKREERAAGCPRVCRRRAAATDRPHPQTPD